MVSTRDLSKLPEIPALRDQMQRMAALNAAFAVQLGFDEPTFSFAPKWSRHSQLGCYDNGCGDELYAHFTPAGCFITGFAHESMMTPYRTDPPILWPGLLDDVPPEFATSLDEPAFDIQATTFVVWRRDSDERWQTSKITYPDDADPDGSEDLLGELLMSAAEFTEWLEENYETDVDSAIVLRVFGGEPIAPGELRSLCPDAKLSDLIDAVSKTGYPIAKLSEEDCG